MLLILDLGSICYMACFTREGTSTIVVYGKHIFQNNFSLAITLEVGNVLLFKLNIFAEGKCGKKLSHQHKVVLKI